MVKIRFKRIGCKHNPHFRIVAADARAPRDGRFIEDLGFYNPLSKVYEVNQEAFAKWVKNGAQITDSVAKLIGSGK